MTLIKFSMVTGSIGFAAAIGVAVWLALSGGTATVLRPDDAQFVARGKVVYDAQCASCHGANLEGQANWKVRDADDYLPAPPHDASGHTWHHPDRQLFELTKFGLQKVAGADYRTRMPAFENLLSDSDILAALSYIKSRWPQKIRKRHDRLNSASVGQ